MGKPSPTPDPWITRYVHDVIASIRKRRMSMKLTQQQVAERLAWSRTTVVALEAGKQTLTVEQLVHLACALRAGPWDFLPFALFNAEERRTQQKLDAVPFRKRPRNRGPRPPGLLDD